MASAPFASSAVYFASDFKPQRLPSGLPFPEWCAVSRNHFDPEACGC